MKFLLLALLSSSVVLVTWYRFSAAIVARKKTFGYVSRFENVHQRMMSTLADRHAAVTDAAVRYIADVHATSLRAIPVDEIRKHASGVRLQPIIALGVTNLNDLSGCDVTTFSGLKGIGPDSASRIWLAVTAIRKGVEQQPIRHPMPSEQNTTVRGLYSAILDSRRANDLIKEQTALIESALCVLRIERDQISDRTSFAGWVFRVLSPGKLTEAIEMANAIEARMAPDQCDGILLADSLERTEKAQLLGRPPAMVSDFLADFAKNPEFYRISLDAVLGAPPMSTHSISPTSTPPLLPAEIPIPISTPGVTAVNYTIPGASIGAHTGGVLRDLEAVRLNNFWIPQGNTIQVGNFTITGGMIYVGPMGCRRSLGAKEPSLIDPSLEVVSVRKEGLYHQRFLEYWPVFCESPIEGRTAYLQWLADGRCAPKADVGYVFLYFYGLERRALHEAQSDPDAKADIPAIVNEVIRLRNIYAWNHSFDRYSASFLEYVEAAYPSTSTSHAPVPDLAKNYLSLALRKLLGGYAKSQQPLPAELAYMWFYNDPRSHPPPGIENCHAIARSVFAAEYTSRFGRGLILPCTRAKIKVSHKAASRGFINPFSITLDLPDPPVLSTSYAKIADTAVASLARINGYIRILTKNPDAVDSLDALLALPSSLWSDASQSRFLAIKDTIQKSGTAQVFSFADLLKFLPTATGDFTKLKYKNLCSSMVAIGLGVEPDPRFGGVVPSLEDPVSIFLFDGPETLTSGYSVASLLVQLACVTAMADGVIGDEEVQTLLGRIESVVSIPKAEQSRLAARVELYRIKTPGNYGLKKAIEKLSLSDRDGILSALIAIIQADGTVSPAEVKELERIYGLFGANAADLYSAIHLTSSQPSTPATTLSPARKKRIGVSLDMEKVARLKADTDALSAKLKVIYETDETESPSTTLPAKGQLQETAIAAPILAGLDPAHNALLLVLLGRQQWTRNEFEEICSDKGLMPDGAIERINEAAFEKFDQAVIEGDDPIDIAIQFFLPEDPV